MVREYLTDCTGEMVEDLERIYAKMSTVADEAVAAGAQIVHRTAKGGADMVAGAASKSRDMVVHASEVPGALIQRVRHWHYTLPFTKLPAWMKDNEYLQFGHRPEVNSFLECFKSIWGIHSETGNIWTHLIGFVAFITVTIIFYLKPLCSWCNADLQLGEKLIFLFFFIGAILCLGLSTLFHTMCCHSEQVSKLFCKLDYVGISLLIVGSFVPWIYYGFYCQFIPKVVYLTTISVLGVLAIIVTMMDRFSSPAYRPARALLFVCLGGFGFIPAIHTIVQSGWSTALVSASIHRVFIMGFLYILGAVLYGARVPERILPGMCDIWFQSHQIFHVLVIAAAFVHYHGMTNMAVHRLTKAGECVDDNSTNHLVPEMKEIAELTF
jgi:adiponectin receptor